MTATAAPASGPPMAAMPPAAPGLTEHDRRDIARVRELAALRTADAMRQHFGGEDGDMARAATLGALQEAALTVAALAERLGGGNG